MRIQRRDLLLAVLASTLARAEATSRTFVLVPGAWHGAWCFAALETILRAKGHTVHSLTLTGVGDRASQATASVNLSTHIEDVVGFLCTKNLSEVCLLGHSYGGMVITGVAAREPKRISQLIYLDAFVPASGQSMFDLSQPKFVASWKKRAAEGKSGFLVPPMLNAKSMGVVDALQAKQVDAALTPQPIATFEEPVVFDVHSIQSIPSMYIHCTKFGGFGPTAERVKKLGFRVVDIESGHDAMLAVPQVLADAMLG